MDSIYLTPIQKLPGVGPVKLKALQALPVLTFQDLLSILPRIYELRRRQSLKDLKPGAKAIIVAEVTRLRTTGAPKSQRLEMVLQEGGKFLKLVFFKSPQVQYLKNLKPNTLVTAVGQVTSYNGVLQIAHPVISMGNQARDQEGVWPIYPELKNIKSSELAKLIRAALTQIKLQEPQESLPKNLLSSLKLMPLLESYEALHKPKAFLNSETLEHHPAYRRIAFEEIYCFQRRLLKHRKSQQASKAPVLKPVDPTQLFKTLMPFEPTKAQARVLEEIFDDLSKPVPMLRLLQGDVGSGKTAVAASATAHMRATGYQTAVMAPTEILAEQHFKLFESIFGTDQVARLQGSMRVKEKREALEQLKSGAVSIAVGTHALISESVEFKNLGLCIIDEQHRFGVEQRAKLRAKGFEGEKKPHVLAMTATPIPRSLALTAYGDFTVSVINELPPGRTPVATHILRGDPTKNILTISAKCLRDQEQAYVIYPLVEESEKIDLLDAQAGFQTLVSQFGPEKVALIHGRLSNQEKDEAMNRFKSGKISFLVSTTVVEVGVDVPNASCMMIVHPERFGLSQLHQLRGRVGRGKRASSCYLLTDKLFLHDDAYKRLNIMEKSQDGFEIASEDLKIRGPGDFLGTRQSGLPIFQHFDLIKHADLIEPARKMAENNLN